ncbi:MAG: peptidylamidoglycolate lyase [Saprospiraceae bacterium]|jgi:peptidylamidoglycolate lyase
MKKSRRNFLKKSSLIAGASVAIPHFSFGIINKRKLTGAIIGHGDFKYHVDKEWGVQDSLKIPVKDCHEMVQDAKGRLILLTNHTKNNVLIYDRSGKVLDTWTLNASGAHGLTITAEGGQELLFATDSDNGKVYKTTLDGKVLLELNAPTEISNYADPTKFHPTEVAVAPNGDFYVADGYGENLIIRYSHKGEYLSHFGGKGRDDDQFDCCHGVTLDTRDASNPTLLITSRTAHEYKRFTFEGKHLETIKLPGCWNCRPVIKGDYLYFAILVTETWGSYDGLVAILDKNNKVVSFPGGSEPIYKDGALQAPSSDLSTFLNPHDVCIDNDENIYVPQWYSGRSYPVKLERV